MQWRSVELACMATQPDVGALELVLTRSAHPDFDLSSQSERAVTFSLGSPTTANEWFQAGARLGAAITKHPKRSFRLAPARQIGDDADLHSLLLGVALRSFHFSCKSAPAAPQRLVAADEDAIQVHTARYISNAVNRARAWTARPANTLTPKSWAEEIEATFSAIGAKVHVFDDTQLEAIGAHALIATGRGGEHTARLAIVEWRGAPERREWDAALIGKGVTFDSGGLDLKPAPGIAKMKLDMAGAAAVLGALEVIIHENAKLNVVALAPIAENAIDARSMRPGDIVSCLAGLTIEIANTDAEGRLMLADAITYANTRYAPRFLVDLATLTVLVSAVLHEEYAGLYCNDDQLANMLLDAGLGSDEPLWRMPLSPRHDYLVHSEIADLRNLGAPGFFSRGEGSPTAGAAFLKRFAEGARWAHIDICGVAWSSRLDHVLSTGPTGFGVRMLADWLRKLEGCV